MEYSEDEGAKHADGDDDDAASVSSEGSRSAEGSERGSEVGSDGRASPANSVHSANSDDEVHVSETEGPNKDSGDEKGESDREEEEEQEENVESGREEEEEQDEKMESDREEEEEQEEKMESENEQGHSDKEENVESDKEEEAEVRKVESEEEEEKVESEKEDERSDGEEKQEASDVEGHSDNELKVDTLDKEEDEGNDTKVNDSDVLDDNSSPQRMECEDSVPEVNIDSGEEEGHHDSKESHMSEDGKGSADVPSDNEDVGSPKARTDDAEDDDLGQGTSSKTDEGKPHDDDDDDSDEEVGSKKKKEFHAHIFGSSGDEAEGSDTEAHSAKKKRRRIRKPVRMGSSDSDEKSDEEKEEAGRDSEDEKPVEREGGEEEEENKERAEESEMEHVEEKVENETEPAEAEISKKKISKAVESDDDSGDERKMGPDFVSDFELMLQKKKDNAPRRKRKDVDIINDSDDLIAEIISKMRQAADDDKQLNKQKKTATKKLKILPLVMSQLKKQDLKMAFLDQGVLNVIADWLAPLPDRSLPHLHIREGMIKMLNEFPPIDHSLLKSSGVGRVLMYLYKHPKETKENKEKAGKLITEWARPIFSVTTDYHSLTKEEREQRDFEHIPKRKKLSKDQAAELEENESRDIEKALNESDRKLRPGDKGWVGRARVPTPSTKDYVVRPKWNVEMEFGRSVSRKPMNRFEKHLRTVQEKKRNSKHQRAVTISIEGRKMAI